MSLCQCVDHMRTRSKLYNLGRGGLYAEPNSAQCRTSIRTISGIANAERARLHKTCSLRIIEVGRTERVSKLCTITTHKESNHRAGTIGDLLRLAKRAIAWQVGDAHIHCRRCIPGLPVWRGDSDAIDNACPGQDHNPQLPDGTASHIKNEFFCPILLCLL